MKRIILIASILTLIAACGPSTNAIQTAISQTQTLWTPIHTQTKYPTLTFYPTYTLQPTIVITKIITEIVTITETSTPLYTPTMTGTPTNTSTPTVTPNINATNTAQALLVLRSKKNNGFYLVNIDIAPGVWRSTGTGDSCYWEITTTTGDIISNHFGMSSGTMYIPITSFQVMLENCGIWEFISP